MKGDERKPALPSDNENIDDDRYPGDRDKDEELGRAVLVVSPVDEESR